jgi:hypothetical protein
MLCISVTGLNCTAMRGAQYPESRRPEAISADSDVIERTVELQDLLGLHFFHQDETGALDKFLLKARENRDRHRVPLSISTRSRFAHRFYLPDLLVATRN